MAIRRPPKEPTAVVAIKRTPEEKAAMLRQIDDLQARFQRRENELNSAAERLAADINANIITKERAIRTYNDMMQKRGIPEVQRRERLSEHFGTPLPPLLRSKK